MKKLLILTMVILGTVSFARDFEYNEKRDIVKPMEENIDRLSRFTPQEWQMDKEATEMNFKKYEWNKNSTDAIDVYYDVKDQFVDFENAHINLTDACYDYIITVAKVFFKMRKLSNIEIHFNNTGSVMWFHLPFDQYIIEAPAPNESPNGLASK